MSDTQWPRYEVFEQERPGQPHQNAGAVHAPDGEMALQNARDVFARRPDCHSLWVAPASQIYSRTAEELAMEPAWREAAASADARRQTYQVFRKLTQRQSQTFVTYAGAVEAGSPAEALRLALEQYGEGATFVWWIVPDAALTRSEPSDAGPMFGPARDKPFRMPNYYRVNTELRTIRAGTSPDAADEHLDSEGAAGDVPAQAPGEAEASA